MHIEHLKSIKISNSLADIKIMPHVKINVSRMKYLIQTALDDYLKDTIAAEIMHEEIKKKYGEYYQTPGYNLRIYRFRADLTQKALADLIGIKQHHLSEMEHNKRSIGKKLAQQLAKILNFDYRELL